MKAYVIYDNDYEVGEKVCMIVKVKDNENIYALDFIVDHLKYDYYNRLSDSERDETSLENEVLNGLTNLGYEVIPLLGEYDLSL